jgi:hypothetical protein
LERCLFAVLFLCSFSFVPQNAALAQTVGGTQQSPPPLGKLVDVGGYRVHLYCVGSGSPAVVILGAGYSFDWGLVQPQVARITQVCAYDHSGGSYNVQHYWVTAAGDTITLEQAVLFPTYPTSDKDIVAVPWGKL